MTSGKFKGIIKIVLTIVVLIILFHIIQDNYNEIKKYEFNFRISYLLASFVILLIATLILPFIWYLLTRNLNCHLGFFESMRVRLISEVGKYIPGRVFGYGYLLLHYKNKNKSQIKVLNSAIYELFLTTFSAFLFFTITYFFKSFELLNAYRILFITVSFAGIIFLHPWFFTKISDFFCRIFKKEKLTYTITYLKILSFLALYLLFWIVFSIAFFLFANTFTSIGIESISYISGSFAISTFAGFMAFFLPAGIGAREGLLIYLLGNLTGNILAIVISIGSRIWLILCDLFLFLAALIAQSLSGKNRNKEI